MTSVTITAKVGPNLDATALVFDDVKSIKYEYTVLQTNAGVVHIEYVEDNTVRNQSFDLDGVTTVTHTITGANTAIVIS